MANKISENNFSMPYLLVLLVVGFLWIRSSLEKIEGGKFVSTLGGTLGKFASNNPYPWFKNLLQTTAIPNSQMFGMMVMVGELVVAITITVSVLMMLAGKRSGLVHSILLLGLLGGLLLNGTFWLAAGWMSPSTDGLNLLMFSIELIGFFYLLKQRAVN